MMFPLGSISIGELNPKCAMLPAICAICASEWRLGFLGDGASSVSFQCSILCATACESMPHLPLKLVWRFLSEGASWTLPGELASGYLYTRMNFYARSREEVHSPTCTAGTVS